MFLSRKSKFQVSNGVFRTESFRNSGKLAATGSLITGLFNGLRPGRLVLPDLPSMCRSSPRSCAGICFFECSATRGSHLPEIGWSLNGNCGRLFQAMFLSRCGRGESLSLSDSSRGGWRMADGGWGMGDGDSGIPPRTLISIRATPAARELCQTGRMWWAPASTQRSPLASLAAHARGTVWQ